MRRDATPLLVARLGEPCVSAVASGRDTFGELNLRCFPRTPRWPAEAEAEAESEALKLWLRLWFRLPWWCRWC